MTHSEVRQVLHYAALLPAAVGKDLPPEADASHKTLVYDPAVGGFTPAGSDALPLHVVLRIEDLTLRVLDKGEGTEDRFALVGRTLDQAESWLNDRVLERWPEVPAPVAREVYEDLPPHVVAEGGVVPVIEGELRAFERLYAQARTRLEEVRDAHPQALPIRIWPHHFDQAVLLPLGAGAGAEARSIGIGFSPGDSALPEPYWYVTPWPYPAADRQPADPPIGRWRTEPFFGATLETSPRIREDDAHPDTVRRFLSTALSTARDLLGNGPAGTTHATWEVRR